MDAPEISILREDDEETPPPEFSKFRLDTRLPTWNQGGATGSGSIQNGQMPGDSDDEDEEEDQLIDDDELAIVTETGRADPTVRSHKRGAPSISRGRGKRGGTTGRRGRPGREPPDAAAMMSTFEVSKAEDRMLNHGSTTPHIMMPVMANPSQVDTLPVAEDWSTAPPPKAPRKKPGPKKGTTIGPRGPRKGGTSKTGNNTPGTATPLDDIAPADASQFLIPVAPSVPVSPKSDHPPLSSLPPTVTPDLTFDPSTPVPSYPLPTRAFAVSQPPKIPTGYAPFHPLEKGPARKWTIMQREIRGIGGGRWFARTWVAPQTLPQQQPEPEPEPELEPEPETRPPTPPPVLSQLDSLALVAAESSRLPDVGSTRVVEDGDGEGEEPGKKVVEGPVEGPGERGKGGNGEGELGDEEMKKPEEVELSSSRVPSIVSSSPPPLPLPSGDIDRDGDVEMAAALL
ncbi:hypothetical protein BU17DRAFT_100436 [Hysterangium stoloniferum]|nr:hypothetical protein BU17DRAFT_100436 [Hysterangium stoloniferum]